MKSSSTFALITGASRGIGLAFAEECLRRKIPVALVALPGENLEAVAQDLHQKYQLPVRWFETNLAEPSAPHSVADWIQTENLPVGLLVNNAGFGMQGYFSGIDHAKAMAMLQVNLVALVSLTRLLLPVLQKNKPAFILNVGSSAGFQPVPTKAAYGATKAFIQYFSEALREELRLEGIKVACVAPNAVKTNEAVMARIRSTGWIGKMSALTPEEVAQAGLNGLFRGKSIIVPGFFPKFSLFLSKLVPKSFTIRALGNTFRKSEAALERERKEGNTSSAK